MVEYEACASAETGTFGALLVEVQNNEPTPLGLGVDESYTLELGVDGWDGALTAKTEWGALRGIESFVQLAQWDGSQRALCALPLTVSDSPAYSHRGVLLDTARHFYPLDTALLPLLDGMAALKLNVLHWHLADAHSVPLASTALPRLAAEGAMHPTLTYSAADMRAVVAAARERGIRVVPELDMPAHTSAMSFGLPEALVTCPERVASDDEGLEHGANKAAMHPLREATYEAVDALLRELAAIFPEEYLHLGGDEVDGDCWLSDAEIRAWASQYTEKQQTQTRRRRGRSARPHGWVQALQAHFTRRVGRIASSLGKRVVLWDEALEVAELLEDGPSAAEDSAAAVSDGAEATAGKSVTLGRTDVTVDVWRDWMHGRRQLALQAGHDVIWSSLSWYLDLPGNTWDSMYSVALPPAPSKAAAPSSAARAGAGRLLGGETSSWSEHADPTNLMQRVLTRAAAVAERLWSGPPSQLDIARQRLAAVRCRLVQRGLHASPVLPDHCEPPRWSVPRAAAHRLEQHGGRGAAAEQPAGTSSAAVGTSSAAVGTSSAAVETSDNSCATFSSGADAIPRAEVERLLARTRLAHSAKSEDVERYPGPWSRSTAWKGALSLSCALNALLMYIVMKLGKRVHRLTKAMRKAQ